VELLSCERLAIPAAAAVISLFFSVQEKDISEIMQAIPAAAAAVISLFFNVQKKDVSEIMQAIPAAAAAAVISLFFNVQKKDISKIMQGMQGQACTAPCLGSRLLDSIESGPGHLSVSTRLCLVPNGVAKLYLKWKIQIFSSIIIMSSPMFQIQTKPSVSKPSRQVLLYRFKNGGGVR
jgi:hypothetical protein